MHVNPINSLIKSNTATVIDVATATLSTVYTFAHESTGTTFSGFGETIEFRLKQGTTAGYLAGAITVKWDDVTNGGSSINLQPAYSGALYYGIQFIGSAAGAKIGLFGVTPVVQPTGDISIGLLGLGVFGGASATLASPNLTGRVRTHSILLQDVKSNGTAGGTSSSTTWHTRALAEINDTGGHCAVSSNQFVLSAGTYWIRARAPSFAGNQHKLRLQNITDGTTVLVGSSADARASAVVQTDAFLTGPFTIAASKTLALQHYITAGRATDGLGTATSAGVNEIYAEVELEKEAT